MTFKRTIIAARRALGETLKQEFRPLEQSADATAIKGFRFLALTLERRSAAALPATAGEPAIDLRPAATDACGVPIMPWERSSRTLADHFWTGL